MDQLNYYECKAALKFKITEGTSDPYTAKGCCSSNCPGLFISLLTDITMPITGGKKGKMVKQDLPPGIE